MATCESEEQCSTASTSTGEYIVIKSVSKVETSCERQIHMYVVGCHIDAAEQQMARNFELVVSN